MVFLMAASCRTPIAERQGFVRLSELDPTIHAARTAPPPPSLELTATTLDLPTPGPDSRSAFLPGPDGYDLRSGFFGPAGTQYRFDLEIGADAVLRVDLAGWAPAGAETPVRFRVSARGRQGLTTLLDRSLVPAAGSTWESVSASLSEIGAGRIELELSSEGAPSTWVGWASPEVTWKPLRRQAPNLILISLDTLRADHLGCYGYKRRPTTPALDAFAARSLRFANAISQAPWTKPSHRAMFSGSYPSFTRSEQQFLAFRLWQRRLRTVAIVGGGQLDKQFGFAQGFETYQAELWVHRPELALELLRARPDRQFFLFLHTYEIHDPYTDLRFAAPMPKGRVKLYFGHKDRNRIREGTTQEEKDYVEALYDGDLAFTDEQLGKLLALLEQEGVLDTSIIVITSDHGEEFWEHGAWRHGQSLYDELLRVPLIVWLPPALRRELAPAFPVRNGLQAVIEDQVGLIDLLPTLFELLHLEVPTDVQGHSLLPLLRGERMPQRPLMGESLYMAKVQKKSLRGKRFKLIVPQAAASSPADLRAPAATELYDLIRDAAESTNIALDFPRLVGTLYADQRRISAGGALVEDTPQPTENEKLRKDLEALGYIDN